jgi:hypothetical protein
VHLLVKRNSEVIKMHGTMIKISDGHDHKTRQRSDLPPVFCITDGFNKVNNMEIKLSLIILPSHLKF